MRNLIDDLLADTLAPVQEIVHLIRQLLNL